MQVDAFQWEPLTGEAAWVTDSEGIVLFWNAAAERLFGFSAGEAVGRHCHDLIACCSPQQMPLCPLDARPAGSRPARRPPQAVAVSMQARNGQELTLQISTLLLAAKEPSEMPTVIIRSARVIPGSEQNRQWRVYLLGPIRLERPDRSAVEDPRWRRTKVRGLLALLAMQAGNPVHREALLETLWPDLSRRSGLTNLNSAVSDLRHCLKLPRAEPWSSAQVVYESNHYMLHCDAGIWLDTATFGQAVTRARNARHWRLAIAHYREAMALYRGTFLDDVCHVCDCEQLLREQERWRDLYVNILEECAWTEESQKNGAAAEALYDRVLAEDPCREFACRRLMALLIEKGDRARARRAFNRLAEALDHDLNMSPSLETIRLLDQ